MEPIMKSEIFFFITSISVILITVVLVIAGYYVIKTLQNLRDISETLKNAAHSAEADIEEIRERVTGSTLFTFIFGKNRKKK
jgi:uncharacterized protein YoxC